MSRMRCRASLIAGAAALAAATAGCGNLGLFAAGRTPAAGAPAALTEHVAPSALVVVTGADGPGLLLRQMVIATARPREDLDILRVTGSRTKLVASVSPGPAQVKVPGKPAAPGRGTTSYQQAVYHQALKRWRRDVTAGRRAVAARTAAAASAWARRQLARPAGPGHASEPARFGLAARCQLASSALTGLVDQAGAHLDGHRVIVLSTGDLRGMPPEGELNGDDVIVVSPAMPTPAHASGAQEKLLAAGADWAAVLGPEASPAQLDRLVADGLNQQLRSTKLSGHALFGNDSAVLRPTAARLLTSAVAQLRQPGAIGVVNGYASASGSPGHNQRLSRLRAEAVAAFLAVRGVNPAALLVVGHGASDLVAPGPSADNRRVVIVIEGPVPGSA